jgi:hypothetical protein
VEPVRPDYKGACVTNVVRGLQAGAEWAPRTITGARAIVLLIIDGFGWNELDRRRAQLPTLASMDGGPITTVVPSTTPTALASFSTGVSPAEHGIVGYRIFLGGGVLNVLRWAMQGVRPPNPDDLQPRHAFEGQPLPVVSRAQFRDTKFTQVLYRGANFNGYFTTTELVQQCRDLVDAGERFVYAYYDGPDLVAHMRGMGSEYFASELAFCDALVGALLDILPDDTAVVMTADHGHVQFEERIDLGPLNAMCVAQSGESRFRYLHAKPGAAGDLLAAAQDVCGTKAWCFTRDGLIDEGLLGPVPPNSDVRRRIGDVVLAAHAPIGYVDPQNPGETRLLTGHGSLTADEMLVPLVAARGRR